MIYATVIQSSCEYLQLAISNSTLCKQSCYRKSHDIRFKALQLTFLHSPKHSLPPLPRSLLLPRWKQLTLSRQVKQLVRSKQIDPNQTFASRLPKIPTMKDKHQHVLKLLAWLLALETYPVLWELDQSQHNIASVSYATHILKTYQSAMEVRRTWTSILPVVCVAPPSSFQCLPRGC